MTNDARARDRYPTGRAPEGPSAEGIEPGREATRTGTGGVEAGAVQPSAAEPVEQIQIERDNWKRWCGEAEARTFETERLAYKTGYDEGYSDGSGGMVDHDACEEGWQQYIEGRENVARTLAAQPVQPSGAVDERARTVAACVDRVKATVIVAGETPEQLRDTIALRVAMVGAPTYVFGDGS